MNIEESILAATVMLGIITFIVKEILDSRRESRIANREIYQRLEIESINLFRFDAGSSQVTRILWGDDNLLPESGTIERYAYLNYICQILNLFEMSIRFRKEKIMPPEVFGSWVIWYYDVCERINFKPIWKEVKLNYTCDLRRIIDKCLNILSENEDSDLQKEEFFKFVANEVHDKKYVLGMLICGQDKLYSSKCIDCPSRIIKSNKYNRIQNIKIEWLSDPKYVRKLADFFAMNVDPFYISHGEIQDERADSFEKWRVNLAAILTEEFKNVFDKEHLSNKEYRIAVAKDSKVLLGMALINVYHKQLNPYIELCDIVIKKTRRNCGVATSLIDWIQKEFQSTNIKWIFIESGVKNKKAHDFFSKNGFATCSKVMVKELNQHF